MIFYALTIANSIPNITIDAFEPHKGAFERMEVNVKQNNFSNIIKIEFITLLCPTRIKKVFFWQTHVYLSSMTTSLKWIAIAITVSILMIMELLRGVKTN